MSRERSVNKVLNHSEADEIALRLSHCFDNSVEFWLNLLKMYDIRYAEIGFDEGL